jgi:hypothetical protein
MSEGRVGAASNLQRYGNFDNMASHTTKRTPSGCRALASLIEHGLRLLRVGVRTSAHGKRMLPPVSEATGGPMPGIDLIDLSALQEIDDAEGLDRMRRTE